MGTAYTEYSTERNSTDKYRPQYTGGIADKTGKYSFQDENGYKFGTVYYFLYEPLVWEIKDAENNLILCKSIIDSQAFQNTVRLDKNYAPGSGLKASYIGNSNVRQ